MKMFYHVDRPMLNKVDIHSHCLEALKAIEKIAFLKKNETDLQNTVERRKTDIGFFVLVVAVSNVAWYQL